MALADIVYRIATDQAFAARLREAPQEALAAAGSAPTDEELGALLATLTGGARVDALCRASPVTMEGYPWLSPPFDMQRRRLESSPNS